MIMYMNMYMKMIMIMSMIMRGGKERIRPAPARVKPREVNGSAVLHRLSCACHVCPA